MDSSVVEHLYEILGVDRKATDAQIKAAYKKKMSAAHPDKYQGKENPEELAKRINQAYRTLRDPAMRKIYDLGGSNFGLMRGAESLCISLFMGEVKRAVIREIDPNAGFESFFERIPRREVISHREIYNSVLRNLREGHREAGNGIARAKKMLKGLRKFRRSIIRSSVSKDMEAESQDDNPFIRQVNEEIGSLLEQQSAVQRTLETHELAIKLMETGYRPATYTTNEPEEEPEEVLFIGAPQ